MNTLILLVDDDASYLADVFELAGYLCVEAKDGDDARAWLEKGILSI